MRAGLRGLIAAASAVAVAVAATACAPPRDPVPASATPSPPSTPSPTSSETLRAGAWRVSGDPATLASDLAAPWSVVALPGGGALVSERGSGVVRELAPDGTVRQAGVVAGVVAQGESGLHGLALHETGGILLLYAYYGADDDNRVVRMPLAGAPGSYTLGEPEVVLTGIPRASTHDGGRIAFGPDGMLYVATGDAQNPAAAQDPEALNGKILRLTPDGAAAPGNPFGTRVWSLGHRNVQGLAWTADGTMWASEFGQDTWDELNRIEPGRNYGWPVVEGVGGDDRFADPVVVWTPAEASPSGIAAVGDTVFVAGLRGQRLWAVDVPGGEASVALEGQGRLRDVVASPDGGLWILTNNTDGRGSPRAGDDVLLTVAVAPAA